MIPTYRHASYVLKTIESAFQQDLPPSEIIVINDGSPDNTHEILQPLALSRRIRYVRQENAGQAAARNRGISLCSGEFIALLDDDDLWPMDKLRWQVEYLRTHPEVGMIAGTVTIIDAEDRVLRQAGAPGCMTIETLFRKSQLISPGQALFRASILRDIGGFNPLVWGADDWDLYLRLAHATRLVIEDRVALFYRKHSTNASRNAGRMLKNMLIVAEQHLKAVPGERRRECRKNALAFICNYAARPLLADFRGELRCGNLIKAYEVWKKLVPLIAQIKHEPRLSRWLLGGLFRTTNQD